MKYVVCGYIGYDNFGDELIAKIVTQELKEQGAEKITLISANPSKTAALYDVETCGKYNFINSIRKSDTLILDGGSLLQDVTSLKSLFYYICVISTALLFNKRTELLAQGIGPINSSTGKLLTRFVLKKVNRITVRDEKSQKLLENWGIKSELVQDSAFNVKITPKYKKGIIGVQLRNCNKLNIKAKFITEFAKELSSRYADKEFWVISLQDSYDSEVCREFAKCMKKYGINNIRVYENLSVNEVIEKISDLEYLFAMRFHANVIGIKSGIKTVALNYDPKVQKLAEEYNLPLIEMDGRNFKEIFNSISD